MNTESNSKHKTHHGRPDLIGEHLWGDMGQLILFFIFMTVWITDSFFFKYSVFFSGHVPNYIRIILAVIILIFSGILARKGLKIVFGEVREKPEIINKGVFRIVRHPIYLGSILLYLGLIMFSLSIASFVVWIVIIIFYYLISKYEEKLLLKEFGDAYRKYMKEVPMLIPCIIKRNKQQALVM